MPTQIELIQEAARRGLPIPPAKQALYDEAVRRGLIEDKRISTGGDVGLSALASVPKAITSMAGMATDLGDSLLGGLVYGTDRLRGVSPEDASTNSAAARKARKEMRQGLGELGFGPVTGIPGNSTEIRQGLEDKVTGPLHEPQTRMGKVADTVGQFTTSSMLMGAGGPLARAVQGVVPGLITEAAGQTPGIEGTPLEPWARGGSAVLSGLITHKVTAPQSADRIIADSMKGVTKSQMNDAMKLMRSSRDAGGVPLTWPEAIQHVTGGRTTLDDVARYVEQSPAGGPIMRTFYADRPQQIEGAVNTQANALDPVRRAPEVVGPTVQRGAQGYLDEVNAGINDATRPLYDAAKGVRLGPRDMQQILANPSYKAAVAELRGHPYLGDYYKRIKANSIEMIDAVKKLMDKDIAAMAVAPKGIDRFAGAAATTQKNSMLNIAKNASQEYSDALTIQGDLRRNALEPLQQGPTGKLAANDALGQQINAIFPTNPMSGSEQGVRQAIRAIARKDPQTAANIVGAHIDRVFAEANQKLASGPNQAGGAGFAAVISGNSQQAKNLEAAIRALPNGDSKWQGFRNLLDNLEATGTRKAQNSATSINETIKQNLKGGSLIGESAATVLSPAKWTTGARDAYQAWRMGRNTEYLARLFTDPRAEKLLARMALYKPGTPEAIDITGRVLAITQGASDSIMQPDRKDR